MDDKRNNLLIKKLTPIVRKLSEQWFPPDLKSPEGDLYACPYCDMNCSQHDRHDSDCFLQVAKNTMDQWDLVDNAEMDSVNFSTKRPLSKKQKDSFKVFKKSIIALEVFFPPILMNITPFSFSKESPGVICECAMFSTNMTKHSNDCVRQRLAQILSDYYNPKV